MNKENENKLHYIFDVLKKNDLKKLCVYFHGGGDDGNMEIDSYDLPDDKNINWEEPTIYEGFRGANLNLEELVFDVANTMLEERDVDYVNGNGNDGSVFFDVELRKVTLTYQVTRDEEFVYSL